ncbi:hypothetical protein DH2020_039588 [Rehmannia glutinosa]|uniref:CCHC-type domain-containing protein n=1 Tax=Rehmannia glutinosa TaxID=99300 RepID=A0ABR0UX99_REHGL
MSPRHDLQCNNDVNLLRQQVETLTQGMADLRVQQQTFFDQLSRLMPVACAPGFEDRAAGPPGRPDQGGRDVPPPPFDEEDTVSVDNPFAPLAPRAAPRQADDRRWELGFKLDIPKFHGDVDDMLNLLSPSTVSEAHQQAIALEKQFSRRHSMSPVPPSSDHRPRPTPAPAAPNQSDRSFGRTAPPGLPRPSPNNRCFSCGEPGHRQSACPNPRGGRAFLTTDVDQDVYDGPPIFDDGISAPLVEEHVTGDVGAALVLRRSLFHPWMLTQ